MFSLLFLDCLHISCLLLDWLLADQLRYLDLLVLTNLITKKRLTLHSFLPMNHNPTSLGLGLQSSKSLETSSVIGVFLQMVLVTFS